MNGLYETWRSRVIWGASQSAPRGCGLHQGRARDDALVRESLTCVRDLQDKHAFAYFLVPLAAAAVLKGDDAWAARILGARDAVTERTGATVVDNSVQDLRES